MGEIAEMMLDGTLCECCGEYIGQNLGYPGYCSAECARDRGASLTTTKINPNRKSTVVREDGTIELSKKLFKTLKSLALYGTNDGLLTCSAGQSMYAGMNWEMARRQFEKLQNRGFVERRSPYNPIHKDKAVITKAGLDFLASRKAN